MLKIVVYSLLAAVVIGLLVGGLHLYRVSAKNKKEMAQYTSAEPQSVKNLGRVLVIYYSLGGHTADVANRIQKQTGADLYEIKTTEEIKQGPSIHVLVKQQLKSGKYPELKGALPDISNYDVVFVGAPVWWYTLATPALSFLEKMDFAGKKVVPFSTQGSNYGTFFTDFAAKAKNAQLMPSESFNNLPASYDSAVDAKISQWLNSL